MNEYAKYQFYFNIFQFLLTCAIGIGAWLRTREKADSAKLTTVTADMQKRLKEAKEERDKQLKEAKEERDKQCASHKDETSKSANKLSELYGHLHDEISHLPGRQEMMELTSSMRNLTERIGNLDGRMSGVNRAVDLINQFLIEQGGKK